MKKLAFIPALQNIEKKNGYFNIKTRAWRIYLGNIELVTLINFADTFVLNKIGCSWNKIVTAYNPKSFVSAVVVDGTVNNHDNIDKSWTVELAISMKDLGCEKKVKVNDSWTIGLFRLMKNKKTGKVNASSWAELGKEKFHSPELFGKVIFKGIGE